MPPKSQKNNRPVFAGRLFACLGKREREREFGKPSGVPLGLFVGFVPAAEAADPLNMPPISGRARQLGKIFGLGRLNRSGGLSRPSKPF
jgi:hypothetical protein